VAQTTLALFFAVPIGDPHDRINLGTLRQATDKDD
jgi:hypothetical protein